MLDEKTPAAMGSASFLDHSIRPSGSSKMTSLVRYASQLDSTLSLIQGSFEQALKLRNGDIVFVCSYEKEVRA
jgi:hypothetical protein